MCVDNCNVGGRVITTDGFIIWDDNSNYDFSFWHPNTAQVWPGGGASRCLAIFASYFWKLTDCQFNIGWDETSIYSNYFNPSQTLSIIQYYLYPHIFPSNLRSNQASVSNLKIDLYIFNKVYYIFVRFTAQLRKIIALIGSTCVGLDVEKAGKWDMFLINFIQSTTKGYSKSLSNLKFTLTRYW